MISGITSGYLGGEIKYYVVQTNEEVAAACAALNDEACLGVDTENTAIDPYTGKPLLIQVGTEDTCYLFPAYLGLDFSPLKILLERTDKLNILFNAKYDWKWLYHHFGIRIRSLYDLQVGERVLTVGLPGATKRSSLKEVVLKYLGIELEKGARDAFINRDPIASPLTEEEFVYSAKDASLLIPAYIKQLNKVYELQVEDVVELECEVLPALAAMEIVGSKIDEDKWKGLLKIATQRLLDLRKKIEKHFEKVVAQKTMFGVSAFNVDSTQQLSTNLKKIGFELEDTGEDTLKKFVDKHPVFPLLLEYRGYSKIGSAYGSKFLAKISQVTGRIHANFDQLQADTGRMSSSGPNLQQVLGYNEDDPNSLNFRSCFIARPGYKLITADFSQQELRILADMSDDPTFRKAYTEKGADGKDMDVHRYTASVVFGVPYDKVSDIQRKKAKTLNFFLVYGGGPFALAQTLKISEDEAQIIIDSFFSNYSKIKRFLDHHANLALNIGYAQTISGRKRFLPLPPQDDPMFERTKKSIKRQGANTVIQGSGADVTKKALIFLYNRLLDGGYDATINMVVHDEIVVEVREDQAETVARIVEQSMIDGFAFFFKKIPMIVDAHISDEWKK